MLPTTPSDRIEDFLAFLRAVGPKECLSNARPATEEQVRRLVELCPYPLPPLYLDWLRVFGGSEQVWGLDKVCSFAIEELIALYERYLPDDGVAPFTCAHDVFSLAFQYTPPGSPAAPVVVEEADDEPVAVTAESFRNYLYNRVTWKVRYRESAHSAQLHHKQIDRTPALRVAAEALGFVAYWFSDSYQVVLERGAEVLFCYRSGDGTRVHLYAPREDDLRELANVLTARLGFVLLTRL